MATSSAQFQRYLAALHQKYVRLKDGKVADYIPELSHANSEWFGLATVTPNGQSFKVGHWEHRFTIQSISKVFVYGLALEEHGREFVQKKVGVEPTGEAFNSLKLDERGNRPCNPIVNAGAIAMTALVKGNSVYERIQKILGMFERFTGHQHTINWKVYKSESATGHRNRAMAYLMLNSGMISGQVEATLSVYFQQCSIEVNTLDLAIMGATLANGGINPITGRRAISAHYVQDLMSIMLSCGLYDYAGEWASRAGLPAKSGVGGGLMAIAPGRLGLASFSPNLDEKGNSVRGIKTLTTLSEDFGLHPFFVGTPKLNLSTYLETDPVVL